MNDDTPTPTPDAGRGEQRQAYTIKPMEWRRTAKVALMAPTLFGNYAIRPDGWHGPGVLWEDSPDIEVAKLEAETHYESRLAAALEPVQDK